MADQAERLREMSSYPRGAHKARIITVTSGKGGVGKTNVVVNLALALSKAGKKTVIFDADLGLANVDILLGIIPVFTMSDVVKGDKRLQEIVLEGPGGIRVVPGSNGMADMANLQEYQRRQLLVQLMQLEESADIILIDTGAGLSRPVLGFVKAADDVIVVTTPEPPSITDAYAMVKAIGKYRLKKQVLLVVNQVGGEEEGEAVAQRFNQVVEKYVKVPVEYLGHVVSDQVVPRSVREQSPFYLAYPNSRAAGCITRIAGKLTGEASPEEVQIGGVRGFFNRLTKIFS